MSSRFEQLSRHLAVPRDFSAQSGEEVIEVSIPASKAAALYEKIRNTLDYQDEHLLRRNAIERIMKRFLGAGVRLSDSAPDLLRELVWAQYLPNRAVPVSLADALIPVIGKYDDIFRAADVAPNREKATKWVLEVLATEIEYTIAPPAGDDALVSFMYEELRRRADWDAALSLSQEEKDLRLYIAAHRVLLKSNTPILRYRVLTLYYPDWAGATASGERIMEIASNLPRIMATVDGELTNPLTERLSRILRSRAGIFRVVRDVLTAKPEAVAAAIADPEALDSATLSALKARTTDFRARLRRTVVRAVLFLFITKMLLALILEVPYDLLVTQTTRWYPLAINVFFHPIFLAFISLTVRIPEKRNADDYVGAVRALAVGADHPRLHVRVKRLTRGVFATVFDVLYAALFVFVYGAISVFLHNIGFNWLSISLFLFFISLVTFFGIRIRTSTKDIVASDARSGIVGTFFDILMLPIVRAGSWLSTKVSKINVFIYFFDFIIEAPLKVAIDFVESWLTFVREKKEEI